MLAHLSSSSREDVSSLALRKRTRRLALIFFAACGFQAPVEATQHPISGGNSDSPPQQSLSGDIRSGLCGPATTCPSLGRETPLTGAQIRAAVLGKILSIPPYEEIKQPAPGRSMRFKEGGVWINSETQVNIEIIPGSWSIISDNLCFNPENSKMSCHKLYSYSDRSDIIAVEGDYARPFNYRRVFYKIGAASCRAEHSCRAAVQEAGRER
jgi:hypothetical protein